MLAGNVTAYLDKQQLMILGDAADNHITLTYDSKAHKYGVTGGDIGTGPTLINGVNTSQPGHVVRFGGVKSLYVGLAAGNDTFSVGSKAARDMYFAKSMTIDMGDGNDGVRLGEGGDKSAGAASPDLSLYAGTSVTVMLGTGNDVLWIANANIRRSLNIYAGDGDDRVEFDTVFYPLVGPPSGYIEAVGPPIIFPVRVQRNVLIDLGAGTDHLKTSNAKVQGNLTVTDGVGPADITLTSTTVRRSIGIYTGDDIDQLDVEHDKAGQLLMSTGGGDDHIQIRWDKLATLETKLGAGRDFLVMNNTTTRRAARLDGEADGADFIGVQNGLHGLVQQHLN